MQVSEAQGPLPTCRGLYVASVPSVMGWTEPRPQQTRSEQPSRCLDGRWTLKAVTVVRLVGVQALMVPPWSCDVFVQMVCSDQESDRGLPSAHFCCPSGLGVCRGSCGLSGVPGWGFAGHVPWHTHCAPASLRVSRRGCGGFRPLWQVRWGPRLPPSWGSVPRRCPRFRGRSSR